MLTHRVLLGSASPRRAALLEAAHIQFRVVASDIDEEYPEELALDLVPQHIATQKAQALLHYLHADEILLTADTIVLLDQQILGKPTNERQAYEMLRSLSDRQHSVITGIHLATHHQHKVFSVRSEVIMGSLSDEEIEFYIKTHHPLDKAGSYGIQDWLGWCKIAHIQGSYSNIVGLPMAETYKALQTLAKTSDAH